MKRLIAFLKSLFARKVTKPEVRPTEQPALQCTCGERVPFIGAKEHGNIISIGGQSDVRGIINDHNGHGQWLTAKQLSESVSLNGKEMTVKCIEVADGIMAHNIGWKQPKSAGPMNPPTYPATIGTGTLRAYYESRAAK